MSSQSEFGSFFFVKSISWDFKQIWQFLEEEDLRLNDVIKKYVE
jgi:hypothetical protein